MQRSRTSTGDEPRIEPVNETNVDTLVDLASLFRREEGHALDEARERALRQIASGEPLARAWLVRHNAQTLGYVIITFGFSVESGGRDGFIDEFFILPAARGGGLGRGLLDFAMKRAAELGIRTLHLEVEIGNERAIRMYRAAGFQETGRRLMRLPLNP
ncbi:MAG: GNAT family N-acetyltransferase [Acetobacteraceae bacterium]|nr:GNAT family N-acetyltransferase [Acetobacteraceae bacterium]